MDATESVNTITRAAAAGIPQLYEWGGLVILLTLFVILLCFTIFVLGYIIWQMYKQNQEIFKTSVDAINRGTNAVEKLSEYIKGSKA